MSWSVVFWRSTSRSMRPNSSVVVVSVGQRSWRGPQLVLRSSSIWSTRRSWRPPSNGVVEPELRISSARPGGHDAAAHGQHVGVVVLAGHAGRVQVVAQRRPHARAPCWRAICSPWPLTAEHDAAVGLARRRPRGRRPRRSAGSRPPRCSRCRGRRPRGRGARSVVDQVRLEVEPGVVGSDGDPHVRSVLSRRRPGSGPTAPTTRRLCVGQQVVELVGRAS